LACILDFNNDLFVQIFSEISKISIKEDFIKISQDLINCISKNLKYVKLISSNITSKIRNRQLINISFNSTTNFILELFRIPEFSLVSKSKKLKLVLETFKELNFQIKNFYIRQCKIQFSEVKNQADKNCNFKSSIFK
jgi:hypothetical protein